jgi:dTDP-4-dehydrorhamnose 3,5-epimerase-like enzyme
MKKIKNNRPLENKIREVIISEGAIVVKAPDDTDAPSNTLSNQKMVINNQGMITIMAPVDETPVTKEQAKKVITKGADGKPNGYLIELFKSGNTTTTYMSTVDPGKFKGYHLHKVREANYVCVKGKVRIILYTAAGREEHILSADSPERLHIPTNVPTGLSNDWKTEAWIINDPSPAYDPDLKGEQVEYTEAQCKAGLYLKK